MTLSDLKILYEVFECDRERIKNAIKSIEQGYVTIEEISSEDYFQSGSIVYSSEDWVMNYDGDIFNRDEAFYCEGIDNYVHSDDMTRVYEGRNESTYSIQYVENCSEFSYYDGEYYDDEALDYNDLVLVEDTGDIARRDDAYYHEDEGYFSYPEEDYCRGYHNGSFNELNFDYKSKFRIGFEIEKEDQEVRNSIGINDFEHETDNKWRKEKDGSLDYDSGFELISPTFEFDIDKIFEHIEGNEVLVNHINSEKSSRCGGHIHLSENGLNGEEFFEKIKGYTPLFYALYYGRVNKGYCKGKNNRDLVNENEKYQAIKIHGNRVEFRIISAVPNIKTLKWRSKLLMMIVQNPTNDIMKAYYNVDTKFTKLLKQTYSDEKLLELKERFIKYTREFENLEIKNNN